MHVMKAGDSQDVSRERWHGGRVVSAGPMQLLGIMIVGKTGPHSRNKKINCSRAGSGQPGSRVSKSRYRLPIHVPGLRRSIRL